MFGEFTRRKALRIARTVLIQSRFYAWQSALVFSSIFVLHLILSWSSFLSWLLFVFDIALIGLLAFRAYRDGKFCNGRLVVKLMI